MERGRSMQGKLPGQQAALETSSLTVPVSD